MLTRLALRVSLFAICTSLATGYSTFGDEREEIKLRIVQIEKQAAQLLKEGRKDKVAGLLREQEELLKTLEGMNSQGRFEGRGPSPEQMEKFHKAAEQVHHLRIASEHLKLAGMHDMAGDLMRRVEDIEQDLRNAKEKMAQQMRADRPDRGDKEPPRDQPQREPNRKDQPERPRAESRGPQNGGPDGFIHRLQEQLDQVRAENRELRAMVEKIASGLRQSDKPQIDKPQVEKPQADKPQIEERMLQFAERAIQRKDTDKNGVLTPDEFNASGTSFSDVDTNQDGKIDIKEYATYISRR
ncbi:MAG: hypothetical protein LW720_10890 [Pirellula sp.]|jgi:hypothetical protein|nr:hypothetical protein [Pirellula sp.]